MESVGARSHFPANMYSLAAFPAARVAGQPAQVSRADNRCHRCHLTAAWIWNGLELEGRAGGRPDGWSGLKLPSFHGYDAIPGSLWHHRGPRVPSQTPILVLLLIC